jgi:hypothetical protein
VLYVCKDQIESIPGSPLFELALTFNITVTNKVMASVMFHGFNDRRIAWNLDISATSSPLPNAAA